MLEKIYMGVYNTIKLIGIIAVLAILAYYLGIKHNGNKPTDINKEIPKIEIIKKLKKQAVQAYKLGKIEEVRAMLRNLYPTLYKGKNKRVMEKIYMRTHSLVAIEFSKEIKRDRRY